MANPKKKLKNSTNKIEIWKTVLSANQYTLVFTPQTVAAFKWLAVCQTREQTLKLTRDLSPIKSSLPDSKLKLRSKLIEWKTIWMRKNFMPIIFNRLKEDAIELGFIIVSKIS